MGIKITLTDTAQIALNSMATGVALLLPYNNNMLYLPPPDAPRYPGADTPADEADTGHAAAKKKNAPSGHAAP